MVESSVGGSLTDDGLEMHSLTDCYDYSQIRFAIGSQSGKNVCDSFMICVIGMRHARWGF